MKDRGRHVLLVDDSPDNRLLIKEYLGWKGYQVSTAPDGLKGIELARKAPPSVVLMDISLPGQDGISTTRQLLSIQKREEIPVIMLSAHDSREVREESKAVGCVAFLAKPFDLEQLRETIERVSPPT